MINRFRVSINMKLKVKHDVICYILADTVIRRVKMCSSGFGVFGLMSMWKPPTFVSYIYIFICVLLYTTCALGPNANAISYENRRFSNFRFFECNSFSFFFFYFWTKRSDSLIFIFLTTWILYYIPAKFSLYWRKKLRIYIIMPCLIS